MKNKLIAIVVVICMVAMVLVAANGNESDKYDYDYKGPLHDYLHEIEVDDYIDDPMLDYVSEEIKHVSGGCSSARNGDFVGRNFDYFYNFVPSFVIKTNASEGRFASIGVGQHWGISERDLLEGKCWKDLQYLPNLMLDGVNEKGVYINDNVVMIDEEGKVTGTNPTATKTVHFLYIPRYILDHAESAEHAIKLIESVNITGSLKDKYYLHFMVADKDNTYIVEAYKDKLEIKSVGTTIDKEHQTPEDRNSPIMSNFYNNVKFTENMKPLGIERYKILFEHYELGTTFDGMFYLMQQAKYSNMVLEVGEPWFSDPEIFTYAELKHIYNEQDPEHDKYVQEWRDYMKVYSVHYQDVLNNDRREIGKDWITIHNSTYDIVNMKLQVVVDEDYMHKYTFYLFDD